MNVCINTKLMKDRARADELNAIAAEICEDCVKRCGAVYDKIKETVTS
jgi:hypothetical protein